MMGNFDDAVADVRHHRVTMMATLKDARVRLGPAQLAEDALALADSELVLLGRIRRRFRHNKLLSLAILAGVGWLVGAPRPHDGEPLAEGAAGATAPRANIKEKNNDSGQIHGKHRSGPGAGRPEDGKP